MYLLNTSTLQLEQASPNPKYAILSHVWGEQEVTFRDINGPDAVTLKGYTKIRRCCAQALADGYKYAWIDTCCIDKSSSAELTEAINSMYRWYERAAVCYAYLADVPSYEELADQNSMFRHSRYFKRGWTLQEVIAPKRVIFFAMDWVKIGTRASEVSVIAEVTGVDRRVLLKTLQLTEVSVATKMFWASERETTRVEDRAYSLMGIFGVHMPLLYGEGENAFIRLQHEIIRTSNDQSIFAWRDREYDDEEDNDEVDVDEEDVDEEDNNEEDNNEEDNDEVDVDEEDNDEVDTDEEDNDEVDVDEEDNDEEDDCEVDVDEGHINLSALFASSPYGFRYCANVNRIMPSNFANLFASPLSNDTLYKAHFSMTNSGVQITLPITGSSGPRSRCAVALACVDTSDTENCFVRLDLNVDGDGIFQRVGIGHATKADPRDGYVLKDIIIATHEGPTDPMIPLDQMSKPSTQRMPLRIIDLDCQSPKQEGFTSSVLSIPRKGGFSLKPDGSGFTWRSSSSSECILAFEDKNGGGFVVTIGSWSCVCVHVAVVPSSLSLYSRDIRTRYARPDHILADGLRGCESAPDLASRLLSPSMRVTVTSVSGSTTGRAQRHRGSPQRTQACRREIAVTISIVRNISAPKTRTPRRGH